MSADATGTSFLRPVRWARSGMKNKDFAFTFESACAGSRRVALDPQARDAWVWAPVEKLRSCGAQMAERGAACPVGLCGRQASPQVRNWPHKSTQSLEGVIWLRSECFSRSDSRGELVRCASDPVPHARPLGRIRRQFDRDPIEVLLIESVQSPVDALRVSGGVARHVG